MFLKEYTPKRAEALNKLNLSAASVRSPELLWFDILCAKRIREKTWSRTHSHTFSEIHFVYSGEICYKCSEKQITLGENRALFIPPKLSHQYLSFTDVSGSTQKASLAFSADDNIILPESCQAFEFPGKISEITDLILTLSEQKTTVSTAIICGRIYEILQAVFDILGIVLPETEGSENDARVAVAKSFIKKNLHRQICSNDVAKECCLSPKQLGRVFKQQTGFSVYSYISARKLEYCKKLLLQSRSSIKEISLLAGFESEAGFVSFFKRRCGMPPGMFREIRCEQKSVI